MNKQAELNQLKVKYNKMQVKYGDKKLDSIFNGGCIDNPDICFVFMNPTGKNVASKKTWLGRKSPWLGTKNIWKLFYEVGLLNKDIYDEILNKDAKAWDYEFSDKVYSVVENNNYFITNLGKCTQTDARVLPDDILEKYKNLLFQEISIINPKIIITFGNQVSSIILKEKISVSQVRKKHYQLKIKNIVYKVFPVYYPVGNGIFNIDKSIEDIKWIIDNYVR